MNDIAVYTPPSSSSSVTAVFQVCYLQVLCGVCRRRDPAVIVVIAITVKSSKCLQQCFAYLAVEATVTLAADIQVKCVVLCMDATQGNDSVNSAFYVIIW